jgi:hypothetical protein
MAIHDLLLIHMHWRSLRTSQGLSDRVNLDLMHAWLDAFAVVTFAPALVFTAFLQHVGFEHSLILDFLISDETSASFLAYFVRFLKLFRGEFAHFASLTTGSELGIDDQPLLEETFGCIIRLNLTLERLQEKGLLPYDASPLLRHLDALEELYEHYMNELDT